MCVHTKELGNVPEVRFNGFLDRWEQRKFGDAVEIVTDYVAAGSFADLRENVVYRDSPDFAQLVRTVDLKSGFSSSAQVYVDRHAFEFLYRVNLDEESIILPNIGNCGEVYYIRPEWLPYAHNVLGPNAIMVRSNSFDNQFLSILFQGTDFQEKLKLIISPNGQTKFNKTELKQVQLILSKDKVEQEKLGKFFGQLNTLITLHWNKYEQLRRVKMLMLEKMFPREGCNVPEFRFKGFTDAWEQRKFSDLYEKVTEKNDLSFGMDKVISVANMYYKEDVTKSEDNYLRTYNVMRLGDIAFEGNKSKDYAHGRFVENTIGDGIVSHVFDVFRPIREYDLLFWKYLINYEGIMGRIMVRCTKASTMMTNLVANDFLKESIVVPSIAEQKQIGSFLESIDHLITLHQRKHDLLKKLKHALLQKMFV